MLVRHALLDKGKQVFSVEKHLWRKKLKLNSIRCRQVCMFPLQGAKVKKTANRTFYEDLALCTE